MTAIRFHNGAILFVGTQIAFEDACCCLISCDDPACTIDAEEEPNPSHSPPTDNNQYLDQASVDWSYTAAVGTTIVRAEVDGNDVLGNAITDSGTILLDADTLGSNIVLEVENNCGAIVQCTFPVPCFWRVDHLRTILSTIADQTTSCNTFTPDGSTTAYSREKTWTGVSALNGTHEFDLTNMEGSVDLNDDEINLGSVTTEEVTDRTYISPFDGSLIREKNTYTIDGTLILKAIDGPGAVHIIRVIIRNTAPNNIYRHRTQLWDDGVLISDIELTTTIAEDVVMGEIQHGAICTTPDNAATLNLDCTVDIANLSPSTTPSGACEPADISVTGQTVDYVL